MGFTPDLFHRSALGGVLLVVALGPVTAQQPTAAQTGAIRQSCRSDFMANCSGVQPGGKDALDCLKQNLAKLSGACQSAVSAVMPQPAPPAAVVPPPAPTAAPATPKPATAAVAPPAPAAAAKPSPEQASALRAACRSDFMVHCPGIGPGGAEAMQCLQRNSAQLSGPCRSAVAAIAGGGATPPAPAVAPAVAATAPGYPPLGPVRPMLPRRAILILAVCRAEQQTLCAGVPPGGGRVLSCLAANSPRLSPECYKALAPVTQ